ncbi:CbtA family protein [Micromonospora parathelypteridis]|uniref:Putative cobalt transporter CbtA n=1 Tax=Micromonospora parathelypteridis TaxID=1839617 RepID=A0A840VWT5_9ACTN|nr:CbtA family protein [Micromonospora parathelypteridis]MBB5481077.1 putative cobalt transporter CbtA [Micromonospora parathelypteridis]GGO20204.1 membrane protein [Micromonospora parathelypteridis]
MPLKATTAPPFLTVLVRGLLAGLIAGLLAGAFAYVAGEPHVEAAIAIEEAAATHVEPAAGGHNHEDALVSRTGQRGGLFLATGLFGAAMGGLLATAYVLLSRRRRTHDDGRVGLLLAGAALLGAVIVPFLKYPANPPAVGDPATINQRTVTYLLMVVLGLVAVWAGSLGYRAVGSEAPTWQRAAAAAGGFLLVTVVSYVVMPSFQEVPDDFPATLLWDFRLASLGTQVVLWTGIGLLFAALMHHDRRRRAAAALPST